MKGSALLTLLLHLAVLLSGTLANTPDACMLKWFTLAGIDNSTAEGYVGSLKLLELDEVNVLSSRHSALLPILLREAPGDHKLFIRCISGTNHSCVKHSPCHNHGRCVLNTTAPAYQCRCESGWAGSACGKDVNECVHGLHDCAETALCRNTPGSFTCRCAPGFNGDGRRCKDIDECASSPCQRDGTCNNLRNKFACTCLAGLTGRTCERDLNECSSSPCLNGGTCQDLLDGYLCKCPVLYEGENCEKRWLSKALFTNSTNQILQRIFHMEQAFEERIKKTVESGVETLKWSIGKLQGIHSTILHELRDRATNGSLHELRDRATNGSLHELRDRTTNGSLHELRDRATNGSLHELRDRATNGSLRELLGSTPNGSLIDRPGMLYVIGTLWRLVWKHSYLQVPRSDLSKAKTYSSFSKPCTDLNDGWCNVPNKQLPGAREQMIVAYHMGIVVYAYKSPLNPNLGKTEQGARLRSGWSRVLDKCTKKNGVRPDIYSGGPSINDGLAFDKYSPTRVNSNCDTLQNNYADCRWENCILPKSISARTIHTQMTLAIFVR